MITKNIYFLHKFLIYLIPFFLVFSIFIADLIVVSLFFIFLIYHLQTKNIKIFLNKFFIFFFIFWIYLIINSIFSYDLEISLSRSIPYIRFGVLFLVISLFLNDNEFKKNFLLLTLSILILICFDAIIQYFFGFNLLGYKSHVSRMSGFFNDELVLGSFLLKMYPIFLIALIYLKKNNTFTSNILFVFLISIYFFSIFITGERTAFFNFILFNFFLFLILYKKKHNKYLLLIILIFPMFFLISKLNNNNTIERYLNVKDIFKQETIMIFSKTHENHYLSAYKIFQSHPIFGSGLKTFRYVCQKPKNNPEGCSTHPHNIFMQFLSELGLIGTIFYLFAFFYFGFRLTKLFIGRFQNENQINYSPVLTIIIVSIFISFWPFSPSGSYFNNWMSILNFLPFGFLIHYDNN